MESQTKFQHEKYVFNVLVDNCLGENLFKFAEQGLIPTIRKYVLGENNQNAVISKHSIAPFPSSSTNGHTTLLTGCYNAKSGVINASYWKNFMPTENKPWMPPKFKQLDNFSVKNVTVTWKNVISHKIKTVFEYVPDSISYHIINRGAKRRFINIPTLVKSVPIAIKLLRYGRHKLMNNQSFWNDVLTKNLKEYMKRLPKKGLPQYSFMLYLPTDVTAHYFGYDSNEYRNAILTLDGLLRILIEGWNEKGKHFPGLKDLGYMEKILWVYMSDHASKIVEKDKMHDLTRYLRNNHSLNIIDSHSSKYGNKVFRNNPNLLKYIFPSAFDNADCLIDQVGEFIQIYVRSGYIQDQSGMGRPQFSQNMNSESLQNYKSIQKQTVDWIEFLLNSPCPGRIVFREDITFDCSESTMEQVGKENPNSELRIYYRVSKYWSSFKEKISFNRSFRLHIISKTGESVIERRFFEKNGHEFAEYAYHMLKGKDPLLFDNTPAAKELCDGCYHCNQIWLERTIEAEMPNIFERYFGYFDHRYSPNLIYTLDRGYNLIFLDDPKDTSHEKIQNHDAEYREESTCPVVIAGPSIRNGTEIPYLRNVDILPTILKWLGLTIDYPNIDGRPLKI